jgi:hypothetical protein
MKKILFIITTMFLASCNNERKDVQHEPARDTTVVKSENIIDFSDVYRDFFYSIIEKRADAFNKYIHPSQGLYVIESQGALPTITNTNDISRFRTVNDQKSFFDFDLNKVGYEMIKDSLPKVDCDKAPTFYSKEGSFTQETNLLAESKIWETNSNENENDKIKTAAESVKMTVINTANYRYYFSQIDGKWYITFIDMRRPCAA